MRIVDFPRYLRELASIVATGVANADDDNALLRIVFGFFESLRMQDSSLKIVDTVRGRYEGFRICACRYNYLVEWFRIRLRALRPLNSDYPCSIIYRSLDALDLRT